MVSLDNSADVILAQGWIFNCFSFPLELSKRLLTHETSIASKPLTSKVSLNLRRTGLNGAEVLQSVRHDKARKERHSLLLALFCYVTYSFPFYRQERYSLWHTWKPFNVPLQCDIRKKKASVFSQA